jgi:CheY-like chemotaxis protein
MAYGKYLTLKANEELERAAKMQSDFLANMSHEIRTPMNAVIGFAEMALREDLSETATDYIRQIKNSGNALLAIINDILDYSKIEAGKMDLIPVEYEPLSLIDDVANIIMTRLVDKDVELILDINPNIPTALYGDTVRLRQILINLVGNAVKFTNEGRISVDVSFSPNGDDEIMLKTAADTLSFLGASVEQANNGPEALGMIEHRHLSGKDYNVIIVDWKMPEIDGLETIGRIRSQIDTKTPILLISAYDWSDIEDKAKAAGANGFVSKPLFRSTLYDKINDLIGKESKSIEPEDDYSDLQGLNILVAEDNDIN